MHSLAQWITEKFNAHGLLAGRANRRKVIAQEPSPHGFIQERETHRTLQMSAEDQNWEADTRKRDQIAQERRQEETWDTEGGAPLTRDRQNENGTQ